MEEHFTGRFIGLEKAVADAGLIVAAEVIDPGQADVGAPGQVYFDGAKIRVVDVLAGEVEEKELTISYTCQRMPERSAEQAPDKEGEFIFFLEVKDDKSLKAFKILRATAENLKVLGELLMRKRGQALY